MSYPNPLSKKALEKLILDSKLSKEQLHFLEEFFLSCSNLYGMISLRMMWNIYNEMKDVPKIKRKDLVSFSSIARRKENPYYIYEIDEIFSDSRSDLKRLVINSQLIHYGQDRFMDVDALNNNFLDVPYVFSYELLSYAYPKKSMEETDFIEYLGKLKVTKKSVQKYHRKLECVHYGKCLKDFSYLNFHEQFELDYRKKNKTYESFKTQFLKQHAGNEAEKLVNNFIVQAKIGTRFYEELLEEMYDELEEVGVNLSDENVRTIRYLSADLFNALSLWYLKGNRYWDIYE